MLQAAGGNPGGFVFPAPMKPLPTPRPALAGQDERYRLRKASAYPAARFVIPLGLLLAAAACVSMALDPEPAILHRLGFLAASIALCAINSLANALLDIADASLLTLRTQRELAHTTSVLLEQTRADLHS